MTRIKKPHTIFLAAGASIFLLAGCHSIGGPDLDEAQYWQRANVSDAAFQTGPKVQQMLDRDIARCVTEMRELQNVWALKNPINTAKDGTVAPARDAGTRQSEPDPKTHDGALLTEYRDYQDFEGCMIAKGWERVRSVNYPDAERGETNYVLSRATYTNPKSDDDEGPDAASRKGPSRYND